MVRGLVTLLLSSLLLAGPGVARAQTDSNPERTEAAKKEGELVWYTSMSISDSRPLLDLFEKKYPFIKAHLFRANSEKTLNRIMTETKAGRWEFDVVALSEIGFLRERNMLSPYLSPEAKAFPADFKDPDGYWTAIYNNYFVIGYNTKMVSPQEAPADWEDLLDPKWKGKFAIDKEEYEWYAALIKAWGKERTQKYMRTLAQQDIQWRKGHTLIAQLMSAGEFPVAIVYAHRIASMQKKGAPVEWVNTVNPVVVAVNGIALSAKPQHPQTARLFIDFVLSKEAQDLIRSRNRIPARADVEPLSPKMSQEKLKFQLVPDDMATRYSQYAREFRSIFGL